jgi:hypothetical protein
MGEADGNVYTERWRYALFADNQELCAETSNHANRAITAG